MNSVTQPNQVFAQNYLRRMNFCRWVNVNHPVDDLFVALDLLTSDKVSPKPGTTVLIKERGAQPRILLLDNHSVVITDALVKKLEHLHLIAWQVDDLERHLQYFTPTAEARLFFAGFLAMHDQMHVGDTHEIRPGIYKHFKGEDRLYNVLWTSRDSTTGVLTVEYQPLHSRK